MTKKLGKKRQCVHCSKVFYDLNRLPVICPSCGISQESLLYQDEIQGPPPLSDSFFTDPLSFLDDDLEEDLGEDDPYTPLITH